MTAWREQGWGAWEHLHDVGEDGRGDETEGDMQHFEKGGALNDVERSIAAKGNGADGKGFGSDLVPKFTGFEFELEVAGDGDAEDVSPSGAGEKVVQHEVYLCDFHRAMPRTIQRRCGSAFEAATIGGKDVSLPSAAGDAVGGHTCA